MRPGMYGGTRSLTNCGPKRCSAPKTASGTQVAQGHDLVHAMGGGNLIFGGPYPDQKNHETGAAHCDRSVRGLQERGENDRVHRYSGSLKSFRFYYETASARATAGAKRGQCFFSIRVDQRLSAAIVFAFLRACVSLCLRGR